MKNNKGQALVEYVLIITLITVLTIAGVKFLGGYLKDALTKTSCSIMNQEYIKGEKPGQGKCSDVEVESLFE